MPRVLITDVSSYKAVVILRFLRSTYPNLFLMSVDHRPYTRILRTHHAKNHRVLPNMKHHPQEYVAQLAALIKAENITHVIPVNSEEIRLLLEHRSALGSTLDYIGDLHAFEMLDQKDKLYAYCVKQGINVPQSYFTAEEAQFPLVVKPATGSSANGVEYIHTKAELEECLLKRAGEKLVMQEYVAGIGCGYSGFAIRGKIVTGYGHLRLAEYPASGGSSVWRTSIEAPQMQGMAEILIERLNWSGFFMVEFRKTDDGRFYLIEANPRIWGSIHQGLASGINYFSGLLGEAPTSSTRCDTYLSPLIYFSLIRYALRGRFSPLIHFITRYSRLRPDISILRDPLAYAALLLR